MNNFDNVQGSCTDLDPNRLREECIITPKVYDSCRQQDCLTSDVLGPARAACSTVIAGNEIPEGAIIIPPSNAASVTMDNICLGNVLITEKKPSQFRNGFWDITIKYSFNYRLTFREADGTFIGDVLAVNAYTKRVSLFGSNDTCVQIVTDLLDNGISSGPHILVESKAVTLNAEIDYCTRGCCEYAEPVGVSVTIGLFTIIKLYRIVNLRVESRGFCIPEECDNTSPASVCDFFDGLDFPMDLFAPPQRAEFFAGVSNNIPATQTQGATDSNNGNSCSCGCGGCRQNNQNSVGGARFNGCCG